MGMYSLVIIIVYMTSFCDIFTNSRYECLFDQTDSLTPLKLSQTGGISASDG